MSNRDQGNKQAYHVTSDSVTYDTVTPRQFISSPKERAIPHTSHMTNRAPVFSKAQQYRQRATDFQSASGKRSPLRFENNAGGKQSLLGAVRDRYKQRTIKQRTLSHFDATMSKGDYPAITQSMMTAPQLMASQMSTKKDASIGSEPYGWKIGIKSTFREKPNSICQSSLKRGINKLKNKHYRQMYDDYKSKQSKYPNELARILNEDC